MTAGWEGADMVEWLEEEGPEAPNGAGREANIHDWRWTAARCEERGGSESELEKRVVNGGEVER